LLDFFKV